MRVRHLCAGLGLLAVVLTAGCSSCGKCFSRPSCPTSSCAPPCCGQPAVAAPPCCGQPSAVAAPVAVPAGPQVQSFSAQPSDVNGWH
jgi:hypothetical protein